MAEYYTINSDKLAQVVALVQARHPLTAEQVRQFCLDDWPEGDEHQRWLDSASAEEIADWVVAPALSTLFLARSGASAEEIADWVVAGL